MNCDGAMMTDPPSAYPLKIGRMHEACGSGAYFFALGNAAHRGGTVLWVREKRGSEQLDPLGFAHLVNPDDVLMALTQSQTESLAVAEESLRSGVIPVVVMELSDPLDLTAGRRLQLAAKAGKSTGVAIISDGMGSNAAETRWRCQPKYDPIYDGADSTLQRWELIKNKSGTLGVWNVRWSQATRRINVVSATSV
jgi:protein ImuA